VNYFELYIPARDALAAEIMMAELDGLPFESFDAGDTFLKAYIRADELAAHRGEVERFMRETGVECHLTEIEQQNWNAVWESNFEPVEAGGVVIRAPFHTPVEGVEEVVIMPKMSFGTGHHATTRLMAEAVMELDLAGLHGLDMGSGTGVLAILAAKRGAAHVDAVDIDEWAFENCTENIAANGVAGLVTPILGDVNAIAGRSYDFILANINRNILLADMDKYVATMRPGAVLAMSGILEADIAAIESRAAELGLTPSATRTIDGWACGTFFKTNS
jgi:ribosomal protein L11 methyltransferase